MKYFNKEAIWTYLTLSELAFEEYWISEREYLERLIILKQFINPIDKDSISNVNLYISTFDNNDINEQEFYYHDVDYKPNRNKEEKGGSNDFHGNDFDPIFHYITNEAGKISQWEFHKTDTDFFPSIPHGHAIINHKIKLDPYRGYIYNNNLQNGREKRQYITDLWNDDKFRDAARETIIFYVRTFPHFRWRVVNPLRLPRRRN